MELRHMVREREMKGRTSWLPVKGASQGQLHFSFARNHYWIEASE